MTAASVLLEQSCAFATDDKFKAREMNIDLKNIVVFFILVPTHSNAKFNGFFHNTVFTLYRSVELLSDGFELG